jgi:hypothetical protein
MSILNEKTCDVVFQAIAPCFVGELSGQNIGELCLVEDKEDYFIAVASLHSDAFNDLKNYVFIKERLLMLGATSINIALTVEDEENETTAGNCIDGAKEITIHFRYK